MTGVAVPAGLRPSRTVLAGGTVVTVKETRRTPAVTLHLALRAGSECDPPDRPGTAHLLSRVLDRGTATRSADAVAEVLEGRGASLGVHVNRHQCSLVCTCLAEDFEAVLSLLGDIVIAPAFPESEIAVRKGEVVTAIRQDEDNPAARAFDALMEMLYGSAHPYGRRVKGTIEAVESIGRSMLVGQHAARFGPGALSAVVVGDVDASHAVDVAARVFGGWRAAAALPDPVPSSRPAADRRRLVVPMPGKAQVDIAYGFVTVRRSAPEYYAYWLMNNVLGQYAMGGRLGTSIRERQGMAYSVSSLFDASLGEGPLVVRAGVAPDHVDPTISSIDQELALLRRDGVTRRELDESRQYLIGSMPRALETNPGIATFLQTAELFGLGLDFDRRLPDLLGAVTLDAANAAARALDPDRAAVVIAGPYGMTK